MADTANTNGKKKRNNGPRVTKPKTAFVTFKGEIDKSSVAVHLDAEAAIDAINDARDLNMVKVVFPTKPRAPKAPVAA